MMIFSTDNKIFIIIRHCLGVEIGKNLEPLTLDQKEKKY